MKTLALIPVRGGSKRCPRKNARPLNGKSLTARAIETTLAARRPARVVVSSDDAELLAIARSYDPAIAHVRPAELAADTSLVIDTVRYVLGDLESRGETPFDAVAIVQASSPFTTPADVDAVLELLERSGAESAVGVGPVDFQFHPAKLKLPEGARPIPVLADERGTTVVDESVRRGEHERPQVYARNGSIYASRRSVIDRNRVLGDDCRGYVMPRERSVDVNDELDWEFAEFLAARREGAADR